MPRNAASLFCEPWLGELKFDFIPISLLGPESFIPDEFAVVTVVKISSLLISLNPKKLFIPIETLV